MTLQHQRVLVLALSLAGFGCGSSADPGSGLQINVNEVSIDGTFEREGKLVRFSVESLDQGQRTVAEFDIDSIPLEIALDLSEQTLTEDAHGSTFDFGHRAILVALRNAISDEHPEVIESFHGRFLAKAADRFGEVPIGHPMNGQVVPLTSGQTPIAVVSGCGGDGVSCLPGTSGTSAAVFSATGTCQGVMVQYGDSVCRGRCGVGCNWFDEDYTWDCLDHDVCLDFSNDCSDEFSDAADDWAATVAPLRWSGSTRSMPTALPVCGDSIIQIGEQCDDGNKLPFDGCSPSCTVQVAVCGNGAVEGPEQCDDGNTTPGDGCSPSCTVQVAVCGNGALDGSEACDDGNTTAGDGCSPACTTESTQLVINEVEYDEPGTDNAEFVEIYNPNSNPVSLANKALVFLNASNGSEYSRITLSGTLPAGGYLVVCPKGTGTACASGITTPVGTMIINFALATNNIQNGAPDAIALMDLGTGVLLDALSYEGNTTAVINGLGSFTLVETCPATQVDGIGTSSMSRLPNGTDTNGGSCDWALRPLTPGAPNL